MRDHMNGKVALITGVTGQDGSYLAELLLAKGYIVHGLVRRSSSFNTKRIDHFLRDRHEKGVRFFRHYGDLTDSTSLLRVVQETQPDEIYNLGSQSHVHVSFETPEYTGHANALGALKLLEAIRCAGLENKTRFYQASTSELYGLAEDGPLNEMKPFRPRSPYGTAKLYAYWITINYRESYGIFASNGILFNHESERRGETFVTRKITRAVVRIKNGLQDRLFLGNLDAKRDWGYAPDFVEGMWRILQHDKPGDFVLATGEMHSVKEFVDQAFQEVGIDISWVGHGADRKGVDRATGRAVVEVDPAYFRPAEVPTLLGDASKAKDMLGWEPKTTFRDLVKLMVKADLAEIEARGA